MNSYVSFRCYKRCRDSVMCNRKAFEPHICNLSGTTKGRNKWYKIEWRTERVIIDNIRNKDRSIFPDSCYISFKCCYIRLKWGILTLRNKSHQREEYRKSYNKDKKTYTHIEKSLSRFDNMCCLIKSFLHKRELWLPWHGILIDPKMQKNTITYTIKDEKWLDECLFSLLPWDRVFFYGDLGTWKSTFIRHLLRKEFKDPKLVVKSPTYTYFEKYIHPESGVSIYHFDLYRVEDYATFISIWWDEILENKENIVLVEWPEILGENIKPTKKVEIEVKENDERLIIQEITT